MKNRDIYDIALSLIAEPGDALRIEDYAARAPYILGDFLYENKTFDDRYREFMELDVRQTEIAIPVELDSEFPLSERFVSAAAHYLAAMLVCDSNSELSDKLLKLQQASFDKIEIEITPEEEPPDDSNTEVVVPDDKEEEEEPEVIIRGESHGIVNVYGSIT